MERQGEVKDLDSAGKYIGLLINAEEGNCGFAFDVDGRCAGVVGINGATAHRLGWFFYWMHPNFRGRAAATAANRALGSSGAEEGGDFDRLELGHRVTVLGLFFYFYLFSLVYLVASAWGAVAAADHSASS